jgi:hypothetical protein
MPRLTITPTPGQLQQLEALTRALNLRARELDSQAKQQPIEAVAATALEYGLQELTRVWYRGEFSGAQPCSACGRPTSVIMNGDPKCIRADCGLAPTPEPAHQCDDLYALAMEAGVNPFCP